VQPLAQLNASRGVQLQNLYGCPADWSLADDFGTDAFEVSVPIFLAWLEERSHLASFGIDPRQIRSFVKVAAVAGEGQVFGIVGATVFDGDDMLDVERNSHQLLLGEAAVFAPVLSTPANELA
jgi:hypothetical protein